MSAGDRCGAVVVIIDGTDEIVIGRLTGSRCDLTTVDALARVQLEAGRCGVALRLRDPCPELCALLQLVGLAHLIG